MPYAPVSRLDIDVYIADTTEKAVGITRRRFVDGVITTSLALSMSGPAFAKGIKGFNPVEVSCVKL